MFLDESIIKCYIWQKGDSSEYDLNFYKPELEYWLGEDVVLVIETENHYVMVDPVKACTIEKTQDMESMAEEEEAVYPMLEFEEPEDEFAPESPGCTCEEAEKHGDCLGKAPGNASWVHEEHTLFEGERILNAEKQCDGLLLELSDFSIKIKVAPEGKHIDGSEDYYGYFHIYGYERYLSKTCKCGGKGRMVRDFVGDYHVVCDSCKMGTWAGMNVIDAIWFWNIEEIPCDFKDTVYDKPYGHITG